jgi:hypothetical protein
METERKTGRKTVEWPRVGPVYVKHLFPSPSTPPAAALRINFGEAEGRDP